MIRGWSDTTVALERENPKGPLDLVFLGRDEEMLRIAKTGFYVRGEQIPQTPEEARRVYMAFIKWLRSQGMAV